MARIKVESEAAWVRIAREQLPSHLTWGGFCRLMSWPGSVPFHSRRSDNMKLGKYIQAAAALDLDTMVFLEKVICEMESRKSPIMEGSDV